MRKRDEKERKNAEKIDQVEREREREREREKS
jgi:hypothetical protein